MSTASYYFLTHCIYFKLQVTMKIAHFTPSVRNNCHESYREVLQEFIQEVSGRRLMLLLLLPGFSLHLRPLHTASHHLCCWWWCWW